MQDNVVGPESPGQSTAWIPTLAGLLVGLSLVAAQLTVKNQSNYIHAVGPGPPHRLLFESPGLPQYGWPLVCLARVPVVIFDRSYSVFWPSFAWDAALALAMIATTWLVVRRLGCTFSCGAVLTLLVAAAVGFGIRRQLGPPMAWYLEPGILLGLTCLVLFAWRLLYEVAFPMAKRCITVRDAGKMESERE